LSIDNSGDELKHQSLCEIEVDCINSDILNPTLQKESKILNPGLDALWDDEKKRRGIFNLPPCTSPTESQERSDMHDQEVEAAFRRRLIELLEERFQMKYPFKKSPNDTTMNRTLNEMTQFVQNNDIDDDEIINILDALHNDIDDDTEDDIGLLRDDLSQYEDDEDKIQEENNHLTQIVLKKLDETKDDYNENLDLLNTSHASSKSEHENDDEKEKKIDDDESDAYSSASEDDNQEKSSISKSSISIMPNYQLVDTKHPRTKFKGSKEMIVLIDKLDMNIIKNKCLYYETHKHVFTACEHLQHKTSQKQCVNCDFSMEYEDALSFMKFESPLKLTKINIPKYDDRESSIVESDIEESIIDETIVHNSPFSPSVDTSLESINDSFESDLCSHMSFDSSLNDEDNNNKSRYSNIDKFLRRNQTQSTQLIRQCNDINEVFERLNQNEWFCPNDSPPMKSELDDAKINRNKTEIICYKTNSEKEWVSLSKNSSSKIQN
jgi:hypothetical protein